MESYDVVIVGAGPAGLMAAEALISASSLSILILERGNEIAKRFCNLSNKGECLDCEPCDVVTGVGGAGLFSDGKLCLSDDVGERLKDITDGFTPSVIRRLDHLLKDRGAVKVKPLKEFQRLEKAARHLNLNFECYDVRGIGSENARSLVSELERKMLRKNVILSFESRVLNLQQIDDEKWLVRFQKGNSINTVCCRFVLVAVGRSGARWFLEQAKELGLRTESRPFYLGVRVETSKEIMNPLTRISYNPKLSMGRKGKRYIKTHCFCEGGIVISYRYDNTRFVGGLSDSQKNTSFSILLEHQTPRNQTTYEYSHFLCRLFNQIGNDKVILQRMKDFEKSKPSKKTSIKLNAIQPTLGDFSLEDISSLFPESTVSFITDFVEKINVICPGLDHESTLLYAPALEWCTDRFLLNANMETSRRNLYAIGDGSGTTQGIIASAATGLIAAKDVAIKTR